MQKQIIAVLVIASFTFVMMLGAAFVAYETKPELLGLPPKPVDSTKIVKQLAPPPKKVIKVDSVAIKREQESKRLAFERDSLKKIVSQILDSLSQLKSSSNYYASREKELNMELTRQQFLAKKKLDTFKLENLAAFAAMYNTANPKEVAHILDSLDPEDAAQVLKKMKIKNAARVLNYVDKATARKMLKLSADDSAGDQDTVKGRKN